MAHSTGSARSARTLAGPGEHAPVANRGCARRSTHATTAGTHKIPEDIAAPLRTLYPVLKSQYLDYVLLRSKLQTVGESLQTKLGTLPTQTVQTEGTARNLVGKAVKVLLGVLSGNESEIETYGLPVVVGAAAVDRKAKPKT